MKEDIYQCPSCKTKMLAVLKPEKTGHCVYCHYNDYFNTHIVKRKSRLSKTMCIICGSWYEYWRYGKMYCNNCKTLKREKE
jgi:uncharacterized protein YbaR (Trm112 family)